MAVLTMFWIIGKKLNLGTLFWIAWCLKLADILTDWLIRLSDRRERKLHGGRRNHS